MTQRERIVAHLVSDVFALLLAVVVFFVLRDALDAPRWFYWTFAVITDLVVARVTFKGVEEKW